MAQLGTEHNTDTKHSCVSVLDIWYKEVPALQLFNFFTPRQLCIKVANLALWGTVIVWFPDDDPVWIKTCRNIRSDVRL
jgi:hypothetical protein